MAARINKRQDEQCRQAIRTSVLLNLLQRHAQGKLDLTLSRIKAIEICLRKALPDLTAVEHSGEVLQTVLRAPMPMSAEQWNTTFAAPVDKQRQPENDSQNSTKVVH